jgi:hypothetical protein
MVPVKCVHLPEGQTGNAWEPSKPMINSVPPTRSVSHYHPFLSLHSVSSGYCLNNVESSASQNAIDIHGLFRDSSTLLFRSILVGISTVQRSNSEQTSALNSRGNWLTSLKVYSLSGLWRRNDKPALSPPGTVSTERYICRACLPTGQQPPCRVWSHGWQCAYFLNKPLYVSTGPGLEGVRFP